MLMNSVIDSRMRKVIIYSKNKIRIPKTIKNNLTLRNTQIQFFPITHNSTARIELYGYDQVLKYKSRNISTKTLKNIVKKIDKMPMGALELQLRNKNHI